MLVLDIKNILEPRYIIEIDVCEELLMMTISRDENYIFLSGAKEGLFVYNISNPEKPIFVSSITMQENSLIFSNKLNKNNTMSFVGGTEFVYVVNITNITNLTIITSFQLNKIQIFEVILFAEE